MNLLHYALLHLTMCGAATPTPSVHPVSQAVGGARATASLQADLRRSVVKWKGTKFRGRGKHEGKVHLASGALTMCGQSVCGGSFTLDMRSIAVTDIPVDDPIPRNRLTTHLNSRDFFWTERYPTATFTLRQVSPRGAMYRVTGTLTLRGVTRPLAFDATVTESPGERRATSALTIDRQHWGVEYRFDPIRNEIVDDEIGLVLELVFTSRRVQGLPY